MLTRYWGLTFGPNMDNPNSQTIQNPMEITLLAVTHESASLIGNSLFFERFLLFRIKWEVSVPEIKTTAVNTVTTDTA